jgi:hypothetical protein
MECPSDWTTQQCISLELLIWTMMVVGIIIVLMYSSLLVRILKKGRNRWLLLNTVLIILGGMFLLILWLGYYQYYFNENLDNPIFAIWMIGIGAGGTDWMFAIVHLRLA